MKCYEIYFKKNTVFVWNFFFKFWTKGENMESLKFIFIIIDIKALCISENWEFLTCNDKLNKQKSATCKSGKENVYRKHWVIHVINARLNKGLFFLSAYTYFNLMGVEILTSVSRKIINGFLYI